MTADDRIASELLEQLSSFAPDPMIEALRFLLRAYLAEDERRKHQIEQARQETSERVRIVEFYIRMCEQLRDENDRLTKQLAALTTTGKEH